MLRLLAVPALCATLWFGPVGCGETISLGSGPNVDASAVGTTDLLVGGVGGSPGANPDAVKGATDADENELIVRGDAGGTDTPPVAGVTDASTRSDSTD